MAEYLTVVMEMLGKGVSLQDLKGSLDDFMDLSDIRSDNYCHAMLKTGRNAGSYCSAPTEEGVAYCGKHAPKEDVIEFGKKLAVQKRLLVNGQVVEETVESNKKKVSGIKGYNPGRSTYGDNFTRSGSNYWVGKWGTKDSRCKSEVEEANGIGFIVDRVLEDIDEGISDEEAQLLIQSHKWKYVTISSMEYGKKRAVSQFQEQRRVAIEFGKKDKIKNYPHDDAIAEKRLVRFYTIMAYLEKQLKQQLEKKPNKVIIKGKLWEEHAAKSTGMVLLRKDSIAVGLVKCQRKVLELMMDRKEPLEKITQMVKRARQMFNEYEDHQEEEKEEVVLATSFDPSIFARREEPLTMKKLKAVDYKEWSKIVFWDKCTKYAREQGLDVHEATISELVKRESGRGVTPSIILPCLPYTETRHRNWFCQDISQHLYGPYYMIPVLESMPSFRNYGKHLPDHIYIRYEEIVRGKHYQNEEWQLRYHRLGMFYKQYFGFRPSHPEFVEAREPITMMRAARILRGNHQERLFALKLDEEYLDDIKYDLYRMIFLKGRSKTQDLIIMIYEEFAVTYIQQM
ncbi:hypothetical protein IWQ61_005285, partial [Dispira simplex]